MKEITFYTKLPLLYKIIYGTIFTIITLLSLGFLFNPLYDQLVQRKYYLNRKLLLKYLDRYSEFTDIHRISDNIISIDWNNYNIWIWNEQKLMTLSSNTEFDIIGLFASNKSQIRLNSKIVDKINKILVESHIY